MRHLKQAREQDTQGLHEPQRKGVEKAAKNTGVSFSVQKKANKTGLPNNLKSSIENLSGHSMDDVKVHYNSSKPAQLNAHAYAQGNQIHIAPGQEKHLPHEAWHVVQQKQGRVKPTKQLKGKVNINDNAGLEKEADKMGAKILSASSNAIQKKSLKTVNGYSSGQEISGLSMHTTKSEVVQRVRLGINGPDGMLDTEYMIDIHNYILDSLRTNNQAAIQNLRQAVIRAAIGAHTPAIITEVNTLIDNLTHVWKIRVEHLRERGIHEESATAAAQQNPHVNEDDEQVGFGRVDATAPPQKQRGRTRGKDVTKEFFATHTQAAAQQTLQVPVRDVSIKLAGSALNHRGDRLENGVVISQATIEKAIRDDISGSSATGDYEVPLGVRQFTNQGGRRDAVEYFVKYRIEKNAGGQFSVFCWHAGPTGTGRR